MSKKERIETGLQHFSNFVIFQTLNGKVNIDVYFKDETLWLTQKLIAELYEKGRSTITEHLKNIFSDGELDEKVVCRDFRQTTQHGAIKGKTAAEIIYSEADAKNIYMGLKTWKHSPEGKILKSDVSIAKN